MLFILFNLNKTALTCCSSYKSDVTWLHWPTVPRVSAATRNLLSRLKQRKSSWPVAHLGRPTEFPSWSNLCVLRTFEVSLRLYRKVPRQCLPIDRDRLVPNITYSSPRVPQLIRLRICTQGRFHDLPQLMPG